MNFLITGVAGLLGSKFAEFLVNNDDRNLVVGIDNLSGGYIENINDSVEFYNLDLIKDDISFIFEKYSIDYVYHFAAYAAEGLSPFIRSFNYSNNLVATSKIVNYCIEFSIKRLIFTSSMAVYGESNGKVFDESIIPKPIDPYGIAKYACEMDIIVASQQHGLDYCIIRPHNVYGKNQNIWDKYRNVLGIWMYQHIENKPMTIFGSGQQTRAFSYIDDCLEPLFKAAYKIDASKQIINLGGVKKTSIKSANKILRKIIGGGETVFLEERHEVKDAICSFKKSIDILDFKHMTDLEKGLSIMWNWARKQPKRDQFIWPEFELSKGIYSYWKLNNQK